MTSEQKINVAARLYRTMGILLIIPFSLLLYVVLGTGVEQAFRDNFIGAFLSRIAIILIPIMPFLIAHALHKRKKWGWYLALIEGVALLIYSVYSMIHSYVQNLNIGIVLNAVLGIVALIIIILLFPKSVRILFSSAERKESGPSVIGK